MEQPEEKCSGMAGCQQKAFACHGSGSGIIEDMKWISLLSCLCLMPCLPSCRSTSKKKQTPETREESRLGALEPEAQMGGYYKLKGNMNGFYFNKPNFTDLLPNRFLMRGHVVQLLDPSAGDGWARVKNEDLQIGYVTFENIKIVPWEKQPKPKSRDMDAELDQTMKLE
jgi:hypothetical protein